MSVNDGTAPEFHEVHAELLARYRETISECITAEASLELYVAANWKLTADYCESYHFAMVHPT